MSELLVVPAVGTSPTLAISDEAQSTKKMLLHQAFTTGPISTESHRDRAIIVAGAIQAHLKAVEKSRVEVKEPFLQMGREIDRVASEHVATLTTEKNRINRLVGTFESDRHKAALVAAEELTKEQERLTALIKPVEKDRPPTLEESGSALEARLEAEERLEAAVTKLEQTKAVSEAAKPTGGALRHDWDIEVTDIKALYAAHPQCVELTAKNMAIKDLLRAGIEPAGVRATPKVAYAARATTPRTLK